MPSNSSREIRVISIKIKLSLKNPIKIKLEKQKQKRGRDNNQLNRIDINTMEYHQFLTSWLFIAIHMRKLRLSTDKRIQTYRKNLSA